jgi:hypothetical protein
MKIMMAAAAIDRRKILRDIFNGPFIPKPYHHSMAEELRVPGYSLEKETTAHCIVMNANVSKRLKTSRARLIGSFSVPGQAYMYRRAYKREASCKLLHLEN